MKTVTLTTRNGNRDTATRECSVDVERPETMDECIEMFGAHIVLDMALDQLDIRHQAFVRSQLNKTGEKYMADNAVENAANEWKPGTTRARRSPVEKATALANKLSPTELVEYIAQLEKMANGE